MYENMIKTYGDILAEMFLKDLNLMTMKVKGIKMFMDASKACKKNHWDETKFANDLRSYVVTQIKES